MTNHLTGTGTDNRTPSWRTPGRAAASIVATSILTVGLVAACSSSKGSSGADGSGPSGGTTQIHLFGLQPLTGASGGSGQEVEEGAELAVAEINAAGGFTDSVGHKYTLSISGHDMADSATEAVALVRQAAQDKSNLAIIGPSSSVGYVPAVPVVGSLHIPIIGTGTGAAITTWNAWAYRINAVAANATPQMLRIVVPKLHIKRIAVIYDETNAGQVGDEQAVKSTASSLGYTVVADEGFKAGQPDFSAIVSKVKSSNPDAVWIAAQPGTDAGSIIKQLRNGGVSQQLLGGYGNLLTPQVWTSSNGEVQGAISWTPQDFQHPTPGLARFIKDYQAKYNNKAISNEATWGFDAINVIVAAVKQAHGADRNAVDKAMQSLQTTTPLGSQIQFKNPPNGENISPKIYVLRETGQGTFDIVS